MESGLLTAESGYDSIYIHSSFLATIPCIFNKFSHWGAFLTLLCIKISIKNIKNINKALNTLRNRLWWLLTECEIACKLIPTCCWQFSAFLISFTFQCVILTYFIFRKPTVHFTINLQHKLCLKKAHWMARDAQFLWPQAIAQKRLVSRSRGTWLSATFKLQIFATIHSTLGCHRQYNFSVIPVLNT